MTKSEFIGHWKTRDGSKAEVIKYDGKYYEGYVGEMETIWDNAGFNTGGKPEWDLMERRRGEGD